MGFKNSPRIVNFPPAPSQPKVADAAAANSPKPQATPEVQASSTTKTQTAQQPATPAATAPESVTVFLVRVTMELEKALPSLQGKGLSHAFYSLWLELFRSLVKDRSDAGIKQAVSQVRITHLEILSQLQKSPLNNPNLLDLVVMAGKLERLLRQEATFKEASDRVFAVETALQTRDGQILELRKQLERAKESQASTSTRLNEALAPVLMIADREQELLARLDNTVSDMRTSLATAISQLAQALETDKAPRVQTLPVAERNAPFVDVSSAIVRCADWLERTVPAIQQLGDEREQILTQLGEIQDLIKYADGSEQDQVNLERRLQAVKRKLDALLKNERMVKTHLSRLQKYQNAIDTLNTESTAELLNQNLPSLPEITEAQEDEVVEQLPEVESVNLGTPPSATMTNASRQSQILEISQATGLPISAILVITLYECLPASMHGSRRALMKMFAVAKGTGILDRFGFNNAHHASLTWSQNKEAVNLLLKYGGSMGNMDMYVRNSNPLPWQVNQVLDPAEVLAFQNAFLEASKR